ncbi:MAG: IS30 family transposase [Anaerolineales bacterium]
MNSYKQLASVQRYQISFMLKMGISQTEIANEISVHRSTISRELRRNRGKRGYRPKQAHQMALSRRNKANYRFTPETWDRIEHLIRMDWSPEQISGWLKHRKDIQISHEWIYQYILADKQNGGDLYRHLRCQKKRRKRYGSYDRRGKLPNRVSIDQRPAEVETRQRLGDWEVDTIIGKRHKQALVTLIERKSRLVFMRKVEQRTAGAVEDAIIHLLDPWTYDVHTITADNGKEFAHHEQISKILKTEFYFAHPNAAWERGSNENANGLIRQYFPKKQSFDNITNEDTELVMYLLNNRPRKCLDFNTPIEVFLELSVALDT